MMRALENLGLFVLQLVAGQAGIALIRVNPGDGFDLHLLGGLALLIASYRIWSALWDRWFPE